MYVVGFAIHVAKGRGSLMPAWSFRRLFQIRRFLFTIILVIKSMLAYFVIFDGGPVLDTVHHRNAVLLAAVLPH